MIKSKSHTLTAAAYFKLKSTLLELSLRKHQLEQAIRTAQLAAISEAGLDPNVTYSLDDAHLTVVPIEPVPEKESKGHN